MTRDEHTALIHDLRQNLTNEAKATEILTKLSDDYGETLTKSEENAKTAEKLTKDNTELRDVNMRLFLKVGVPNTNTETKPDSNTGENKPLKYEDLFNEKGGLK
jgi:hypothetical protein